MPKNLTTGVLTLPVGPLPPSRQMFFVVVGRLCTLEAVNLFSL